MRWPAVRQELVRVRNLLPLAAASWKAPWSTTVTAFDASKGGYGVMEAERLRERCQEVGCGDDHWRLKFGPVRPREWGLKDLDLHLSSDATDDPLRDRDERHAIRRRGVARAGQRVPGRAPRDAERGAMEELLVL